MMAGPHGNGHAMSSAHTQDPAGLTGGRADGLVVASAHEYGASVAFPGQHHRVEAEPRAEPIALARPLERE